MHGDPSTSELLAWSAAATGLLALCALIAAPLVLFADLRTIAWKASRLWMGK